MRNIKCRQYTVVKNTYWSVGDSVLSPDSTTDNLIIWKYLALGLGESGKFFSVSELSKVLNLRFILILGYENYMLYE